MSMPLRSYGPTLSRTLGMPVASIRERQNVLTKIDLLKPVGPAGPGSGVRVTSSALEVALLLISCIGSYTIREAGIQTRAIAEAKPVDEERCPFTRMSNFADALAAILTSQALSQRVIEVNLSRTSARASIRYRDAGMMPQTSEFVGIQMDDEPPIAVTATVRAEVLRSVAGDVQAMLRLRFDEQERGSATP
jgi:hypothetical protein